MASLDATHNINKGSQSHLITLMVRIVKSVIGIVNSSGRWNDNHRCTLRQLYFLRSTSNFYVQFSVMKDFLPSCIFDKMSLEWAKFQSTLKLAESGM